MLTAPFGTAIDNLIALGRRQRVAVMCAETVPWRCHRSLIADALSMRGHAVRDILSATKADPHRMTSFAQIEDGVITYPSLPEADPPALRTRG